MNLKIIKTEQKYQKHLEWVDEMFDKKVSLETNREKLQVVLLLIKQYEDQHYPIPNRNPLNP